MDWLSPRWGPEEQGDANGVNFYYWYYATYAMFQFGVGTGESGTFTCRKRFCSHSALVGAASLVDGV